MPHRLTGAGLHVSALHLCLAAAALLLIGALNGAPFFFFDTPAFFRSGVAAIQAVVDFFGVKGADIGSLASTSPEADGVIYGNRSPYYGALLALTQQLVGYWGIVVVQAFVLSGLLLIVWRHAFAGLPFVGFLAGLSLLALLTPLGFVVAYAISDVFAPATVIALALILVYGGRMNAAETGYAFAISAYGMLVHMSHLGLGLGLILLAVVFGPIFRVGLRTVMARSGLCAIAVALALFGNWLTTVVIELKTGLTPLPPPFLLARLIEDGTVGEYLQENCGKQDFALCPFKDRMPMTADEFLWSIDEHIAVYALASAELKQRIAQEAGTLIVRSVRADPLLQAERSLRNFLQQVVMFSVREYAADPGVKSGVVKETPSAVRHFENSRIAGSASALSMFNRVHIVAVALGLLALGAGIARRRGGSSAAAEHDETRRVQAFAALLLVAVLGNALICGATSVVAPRYQARIIWLVPLAGAALLLRRPVAATGMQTGGVPTTPSVTAMARTTATQAMESRMVDQNAAKAFHGDARSARHEDAEPIELTILMPCLNEAETIEACVTKARGFLERSGIKGEVLIADNGSTDGSQAIATRLGARVVPIAERGYGSALIGGIKAARGRYVIMGDADDSYDFVNLEPFVEKLREGYDLVMGNRFAGGIMPGAMPLHHRYLGNPVLSFLGRLLFKSPVKDFHCGLRGFDRQAIMALNLRMPGMEFASEMVVKATLAGLKMVEAPTTLKKDGRSRPPHLKSWRDGWRHLRFLLVFSPRWLFLYPGLAILLAGLGLLVALLPGPLSIAGVTLETFTMMAAALGVILGVQMITFGWMAQIFAVNEGLLPAGRPKRASRPSLETLLRIGGVLALLGLGGLASLTIGWGAAGFGSLDPAATARIVVPSFTMVAVGVQLALTGFMKSVLELKLSHS